MAQKELLIQEPTEYENKRQIALQKQPHSGILVITGEVGPAERLKSGRKRVDSYTKTLTRKEKIRDRDLNTGYCGGVGVMMSRKNKTEYLEDATDLISNEGI